MSDPLDSWRLTPPPARELDPAATATSLDRRDRERRQRLRTVAAVLLVFALLGAGAGFFRAEHLNRDALAALRESHLETLGAETAP